MSYAVFLKNSDIWEMLDSRDMGQDAHGQSDCRIFKPTISLEQNDEISSIILSPYLKLAKITHKCSGKSWNYHTNRNNVRKSLVTCATQLAVGLLLKKLKYFEVL